jgi:hypothetical protein
MFSLFSIKNLPAFRFVHPSAVLLAPEPTRDRTGSPKAFSCLTSFHSSGENGLRTRCEQAIFGSREISGGQSVRGPKGLVYLVYLARRNLG